MKLHILRIHQDEEVIPALHAFMREQNWYRGVILGAAGSVQDVLVNAPVNNEHPPKLAPVIIEEPCEVTSFFGEVIRREDTPDNLQRHMQEQTSQYMLHIHCSVGHGKHCAVTGGGLRKLRVFSALNVYIAELADDEVFYHGFD